MATQTLISLEEYLKTVYDPDVEYIDGELKEKSMVQWIHSSLQSLLALWFGQHRREWNIICGVESRIQVSPARIRLPDVVVDYPGPHPEILTAPPLILIEILSPSDAFGATVNKVQDYLAMGVQNVWIIDPAARNGFVCRSDSQPRPTRRCRVCRSKQPQRLRAGNPQR